MDCVLTSLPLLRPLVRRVGEVALPPKETYRMQLSKGATTGIIAAAVIIALAIGYVMFIKPTSTSVSDATKQKYMERMKTGNTSGGPSANRMMSGGMSSGGASPGGR